MTFRPLLAADPLKGIKEFDAQNEKLSQLSYPLLASPKLDGIRVLIIDGIAVTRSLKPVRNKYVQSILGREEFNGLDGEVVAGSALDPMAFRNTTTAVMAEEGQHDFTFWVFDDHIYDDCFEARLSMVWERMMEYAHYPIRGLEHKWIHNPEELFDYEESNLEKGFEGTMLRHPNGGYKYGRSTVNQEILLKLKRGQVQNGDAEIIGFKERLVNNNEATVNELGYTERSVCKENMQGRGDLGSFLVRDIDSGYEFSVGIGIGLDDNLRGAVWDNQEDYLGKIVRYEWFKYGAYDKPRFPKFICFRDEEDIS